MNRFLAGVFAICIIGILFCGCSGKSDEQEQKGTVVPTKLVVKVVSDDVRTSIVEDFGENVYYFPQTNREFARALSAFLDFNENLEVAFIVGETYSSRAGYIVVCKAKQDGEN